VDDIKMAIKGIGWEGVQRIYMAQDRGKWRALLRSHELLFWFHNMWGLAEEIVALKERVFSRKLVGWLVAC
jgi:hypothetical protein